MTPSRFAVFGHPIAQSLSPRIHTAFGRQLGIALEYVAVDAEPAQFAAALSQLAARGGVGANVTLPLKEEAFALATTRSERALRAGAVNTLVRREDGWHGDNTDGAGLVRDLTERHGLDLRGRRALLLGAGGAARGVAPALLEAGVREMVIINRSPARADALADALGEPDRAYTRYWEDLRELGDFELIVNATAAGREQTGAVLAAAVAGGQHDRGSGLELRRSGHRLPGLGACGWLPRRGRWPGHAGGASGRGVRTVAWRAPTDRRDP